MYCPTCGHQNEPDAKFCASCGKPIATAGQPTRNAANATNVTAVQQGRGGLILTFGILSLLLLGPILGIPAWVMGNGDLKKIRAGAIEIAHHGLTKAGMILGIIGTFISPFIFIIAAIVISVVLGLPSAQRIQANKVAIVYDLKNIAADAYQYRIRPTGMEGGEGSYKGYGLPESMAKNANATYACEVTSNTVTVKAVSSMNSGNTITAQIDSDGRFIESMWSYTGEFR